MQIEDRCVASFHYTLTNDAGETIDSSQGKQPLSYLHGGNNIVSGLEKALLGKQAGDKLRVDVPPEDGYGERREQLVQTVPRTVFGEGAEVRPGMQFRAESNVGEVTVMVTKVEAEEVTVDGNHPLAGETLHFDVEITDVREASEEEITHGHVHTPGEPHP